MYDLDSRVVFVAFLWVRAKDYHEFQAKTTKISVNTFGLREKRQAS